ncbi:hypothetical protein M1N50_00255 [Dehalococcoidia bacterium]|nr:hypothetical protein [Dehalococcoidia bacterium]
MQLERYKNNPILKPIPEHSWESKGVFNAAAIYEKGKVYIVYRAFSDDYTSSLGLAISKDGFNITQRLSKPIYKPREDFEMKANPGVWSGCEDPRITKIGDRFYMCYTAYNGVHPTRVALTSIKVKDFLAFRWDKWEKPVLISPPGIDSKNACILSQKINGKYAIFHRFYPCIWIDLVKDLDFEDDHWIKGSCWFQPRADKWDSRKVGIGPPPIKTKKGWLLIYHGISEQDKKYRLGAMLLDLKNPTHVLSRPDFFILEPQEDYEVQGVFPNAIFPCGAVVIKDRLFVYYGCADETLGVATVNLKKLLEKLTETIDSKVELIRYKRNPILKPNIRNWWEADGTFNPCVVRDKDTFHMVYRAHSSQLFEESKPGFHISFLGYANSKDGKSFKNHRLFFKPEHKWEYFGCEDPRITKFGNQYYIFYTAVSHFPPSKEYVKTALATTKDFKKITKHGIVTPFNSKGMTLFPEKINGKMVVIFALEPDLRPLKTGIAFFNNIQEILSQEYWDKWWFEKDKQGKNILFPPTTDLEIENGAPPIKTKYGWLLLLSYIKGISLPEPDVFGIGAALLDLKNPLKVIAKTKDFILSPRLEYETKYAHPSAIVFPSGAVVKNKKLFVYYGAGDKFCCLATYDLEKLLNILLKNKI